MSKRMDVGEAEDLLSQIEVLRCYCDTQDDIDDLKVLLPLLLDSNSEEVAAAHYALIEMLTKSGGRVLRME